MSLNNLEKLELYRNKLNNVKIAKAKKEGERDSVLNQLKNDFGIENINDIEPILCDMKIKKDKLAQQINVELDKIEHSVDWENL